MELSYSDNVRENVEILDAVSASEGVGILDDVINQGECKVVQLKVGMKFDKVDEMYELYRKYAQQKGFSIKKRSSKKDNGVLRYVCFACCREGKHKTESDTPLQPEPTSKIGCKAKLTARLDLDEKWRISVLVPDHNHETSPSKSRFWRCNKKISNHVKKKLLLNDKAGIRMHKNYYTLVVEAGGYENVTFEEKDCRNLVQKERHLKLGEGDAMVIQNYFSKMQKQNTGFFFNIDLDKDGRLKNIFLADGRCREAYKEFGEVVTFDTTYLTNKYDMPFALFVGVNHHGQSTLFGCGLVSNEHTQTFVWLFRTWLDCMGGCAPRSIITDQDCSMKSAVEIVFPDAKHRWCLWHIMKKIPEKLRSYNEYEKIKSKLKSVVYDTQSPQEFEQDWSEMLEKYKNLKQSDWLSTLYAEKHRWVPCFVKTTFWAGMSTTQRSESMNAFFDGYVHSKTSLKLFVQQYENALRYKMEKEIKSDAKSFSKTIPTTTPYEMEKQAQSVYTIAKFKEFQQELIGKMFCEVIGVQEDTPVKMYDVQEEVWIPKSTLDETSPEIKTKKVMKKVTFKVSFQKDECQLECSCHRFEFRGILCKHAICVLLRNGITLLPERYILRRWRKDVRR
ncbi:protein FAR1-RELATED SEQUENCE 9-like [Iris pallida]|uniref:Protein FAR1-RELATED SEQUENCE 9-like n=2 Tax=Iris pallida TaxID=29817 RepID=A0AAX6GML1_IRIPA|nr:protein FAR1-RELATED SEQUENCE 9-like [Iris pallida]